MIRRRSTNTKKIWKGRKEARLLIVLQQFRPLKSLDTIGFMGRLQDPGAYGCTCVHHASYTHPATGQLHLCVFIKARIGNRRISEASFRQRHNAGRKVVGDLHWENHQVGLAPMLLAVACMSTGQQKLIFEESQGDRDHG